MRGTQSIKPNVSCLENIPKHFSYRNLQKVKKIVLKRNGYPIIHALNLVVVSKMLWSTESLYSIHRLPKSFCRHKTSNNVETFKKNELNIRYLKIILHPYYNITAKANCPLLMWKSYSRKLYSQTNGLKVIGTPIYNIAYLDDTTILAEEL